MDQMLDASCSRGFMTKSPLSTAASSPTGNSAKSSWTRRAGRTNFICYLLPMEGRHNKQKKSRRPRRAERERERERDVYVICM